MIIIAICSIGGIIFGGMRLVPDFQTLQNLNKKIEGQRSVLNYRIEYFKKLQDVKAQIEQYQPELDKIDVALPDDPSMPSIFDYLQRNCSQSGLVINSMGSFSIASSAKYPSLKEVSLALGVSGPYESLKNFLSVLEHSSRLIDVESVSFGAPEEKQGASNQPKDIFSFSLNIKVYSY